MAPKKSTVSAPRKATTATAPHRFEAAKLDALFTVLDAVAWLDSPGPGHVAQFAGIDPRTAGKLLKNATQVGLVEAAGGTYTLSVPYPYKGSFQEKQTVVREALVRLPLLTGIRQFLRLGDTEDAATRKAATLAGIVPYVPADLAPLVDWAKKLEALTPDLVAEDLVDFAQASKEQRHATEKERRVAFISHSSKDKPFVRQLAADLVSSGIDVWIDEQKIRVGESIPEKVAQGLAAADFFLIAVSANSVESGWVKKELNNALVSEVQRRSVHVMPLRLDDSKMPDAIGDKKYADFSKSYRAGLDELLQALVGDLNG